ncbi:hypothetical protein [Sansalvadorimonas verongulae]|uniref:hypothetical protein n=1 Tax=Sansalvadorimonas verongulae TaxID=2172824 RepID=UPI0012BC0FF0|nr:hypothetical protein [Sansalvadorimonas verongulae]MTI15302.1 hypothetical protein [Sansalvadorimonas verongulae]
MGSVAASLVLPIWKKLFACILILCLFFITPHTHAVKFKRFKVTNLQTSTKGADLVFQLRHQAEQAKRQEDEKEREKKGFWKKRMDKSPKTSPLTLSQAAPASHLTTTKMKELRDEMLTERGDLTALEFMGSVTLDTSFSKQEHGSGQLITKESDDPVITFGHINLATDEIEASIQSAQMNIRRITLYDRLKAKDELWFSDRSITLDGWDVIPDSSVPLESFTRFLFWNHALRPLRNEGHASYPGSTAAMPSSPLYGHSNADIPIDPQKPSIHELRLSVTVQSAYETANSVTKPEQLYQALVTFANSHRPMLQKLGVIDDLLGRHVDKISILLHSEKPNTPVSAISASTPSLVHTASVLTHQRLSYLQTHTFLGFEYVYTPEATAASPQAHEIRWDIHEDKTDLFIPPELRLQMPPIEQSYRMGGVSMLPHSFDQPRYHHILNETAQQWPGTNTLNTYPRVSGYTAGAVYPPITTLPASVTQLYGRFPSIVCPACSSFYKQS